MKNCLDSINGKSTPGDIDERKTAARKIQRRTTRLTCIVLIDWGGDIQQYIVPKEELYWRMKNNGVPQM